MEFALDVFHHNQHAIQGHLRPENGNPAPSDADVCALLNVHLTAQGAVGLLLFNPRVMSREEVPTVLQKLHLMLHQHVSVHMGACDVAELVAANTPSDRPMPGGFNVSNVCETKGGRRLALSEANPPAGTPSAASAIVDIIEHEGRTHVTLLLLDDRFQNEERGGQLFNWLASVIPGINRNQPITVDLRPAAYIGRAEIKHGQQAPQG